MSHSKIPFGHKNGRLLVCIGALFGIGAGAFGATIYSNSLGAPSSIAIPSEQIEKSILEVSFEPERVSRPSEEKLLVPGMMATKMGLSTSPAIISNEPVSLPGFQGVLAINHDRLSRIHSRFSGEVVELGVSTDGSDPEIRVGEYVKRGDLLAVVWSIELGEKKNAVVDALAKLRAEEQLRDRLKALFDEGAGAGRPYRDAEKDVQSRQIEIIGLERALRTWRVSDEEIVELRAAADRLAENLESDSTLTNWARVEIRAPMSGVILEKNVVVGEIVDTEMNLFKIADLTQLAVWAHVYEEDLPLLESLPRPLPWSLSLSSHPSLVYKGALEKISAVIDPAQHTALVTGTVQNPDGRLKVGQFVTATIQLPPSDYELKVPASAVVENGYESVVFIQPDPEVFEFVRCPVGVVRRLRDSVYVLSSETGLRNGDQVVSSGALMLQNAMLQLPVPPVLSGHELVQSPTELATGIAKEIVTEITKEIATPSSR